MDGYDAMEYDDGTGTMVEYAGTDCDDSDDTLHPADMEKIQTNVSKIKMEMGMVIWISQILK